MCEHCDLDGFKNMLFDDEGVLTGPAFTEENGDGRAWLQKDQWGWTLQCNGAMWETGEVTVYHCPWCGEKLAD